MQIEERHRNAGTVTDGGEIKDEWREIAIALAEHHAATAEMLIGMKSTSRRERERQKDICRFALLVLSTGRMLGFLPDNVRTISRLKEIISED